MSEINLMDGWIKFLISGLKTEDKY